MGALRQYTTITADSLAKHTNGKIIGNFIIELYPHELLLLLHMKQHQLVCIASRFRCTICSFKIRCDTLFSVSVSFWTLLAH